MRIPFDFRPKTVIGIRPRFCRPVCNCAAGNQEGAHASIAMCRVFHVIEGQVGRTYLNQNSIREKPRRVWNL